MKNYHPAELRCHAIQLARAFDIHLVDEAERDIDSGALLRVLRNDETREVVRQKIVYTSRIDNEFTYAIALHEIGHLAHPGGQLGIKDPGPQTTLDMEMCAWEFAKKHALIWTEPMTKALSMGLATYILNLAA